MNPPSHIAVVREALKEVDEVWTRSQSHPDINFMGDDEHKAWGKVIKALEALSLIEKEMEELIKFADHILEGDSWGREVDGGDAQDKAIELGLVELRPIPEEDSIDGEKEHYFTKWTLWNQAKEKK